MEDAKNQLSAKLKSATNVLVTVNSNPTVDQLAAAIALTIMLNKMDKHATAVFSGTVPSTIEFLKPDKTFEKTADSLRDFIISLDKAKADKLRYKIEENYVRIFITPYHTSLTDKDLIFSQGDYNVDVVVGLGVHQREELDNAVTVHGRILHDATITTINTQSASNLGSINWAERTASSLCEMLVGLSDQLQPTNLLDAQIANALLTGIVAETQRFSNNKTTAQTMNASSKLLAAGANQQLVAEKLQPPAPAPKEPPKSQPKAEPAKAQAKAEPESPKQAEGLLQVDHGNKQATDMLPEIDEEEQSNIDQIRIDDQGNLKREKELENEQKQVQEQQDQPPQPPQTEPPTPPQPEPQPQAEAQNPTPTGDSINPDRPALLNGSSMATEPPMGAGKLNSIGDPDEPATVDPLDYGQPEPKKDTPDPLPLMTHDERATEAEAEAAQKSSEDGAEQLDQYRQAVDAAIAAHPDPDHVQARADLNAQPLGDVTQKDPNDSDNDQPKPPPFAPPLLPRQ